MSIRVENLTVTHFGDAAPVLNSVSFVLADGERVLLLGPSGAGKSTLLLALTGVLQELETATISGSIEVPSHGLLLQNYSDATISDSVSRDVAFGAESAGLPIVSLSELVGEALAEVGLECIDGRRNPATLSGGELQRMCLAGLLTMKPRLLLLDEPTSQLDAKSASEVRHAVGAYLDTSGASAIIAEHIFEPWLPLVSRVLILDSAAIAFDGTWEAAKTRFGERLAEWGLWTGVAPELSNLGSSPAAGSIAALVGPSGSGKSTRIRASVNEFARQGQARIGWLPQNPALALTENSVAACLKAQGISHAHPLLSEFGLADYLGQNPHQLSGGEQRRLALLLALANEPDQIFLDEPTVGQDRNNWKRVVGAILSAKNRGAVITLATHDHLLIGQADEVETLGQASDERPTDQPGRSLPFSPLALLAASFTILIGALSARNIVGLGVALFVEVLALAALAIPYRQLRRPRFLLPLLIGAASVGFSNWWLSADHNAEPAAVAALRVIVFGLPGLLFAATVAPSVLGDQLGQFLRLPARPVVAAMVGLNRIQHLTLSWQSLALVRKVHGVAKRGARELLTLTIQSLIAATRSAEVAAIAMESRGFSQRNENGKYVKRTWAVPARWLAGDLWLVLGGVAVALVAAGIR